MNILLVDDEAHARLRLRHLLEELGEDYRVVGEAGDGASALAECASARIDLVLLDVRMPGPDGLGVAERLCALDPPPAVILVTAFPEYALDAFEHNVADYLVKPVRRERLRAALERLRIRTRAQRSLATEPPVPNQSRRQHLSAHYRGSVQTVAIDDIIYLHAEQKYVTVRHPNGSMLVDESLKTLEQEFPDRFVRIHRSALVASQYLIGLEKAPDGASLAILSGVDERLPVSRRHLSDVRRFLRAN